MALAVGLTANCNHMVESFHPSLKVPSTTLPAFTVYTKKNHSAISMYTNIPTGPTLHELCHLPQHLIDALSLIMQNNIFQFSDTFWKQLTGTAMGTPPTCMWATLFFHAHEEMLQTTYTEYLKDWA